MWPFDCETNQAGIYRVIAPNSYSESQDFVSLQNLRLIIMLLNILHKFAMLGNFLNSRRS